MCGRTPTSLEDADQEVISVADTGLDVAQDVTRSDHSATETPPASFSDQLLRHPLGLAVTRSQASAATNHIIFLEHGALTSADLLVREVDIVISVQDTSGADKGKCLRPSPITEPHSINGREDISSLHISISLDPMHRGAVMNDHVHFLGKGVPHT